MSRTLEAVRAAFAVATLALTSAVWCSDAGAASRLKLVGHGTGPAMSDGARFAAYPTASGMTVLDGAASKLRTRAVALAGPCAAQFGELQAMGSALVAIRCTFASTEQQRQRRFLVYEPRSGSFRAAAGLDRSDGDFETVTGVGRTWLAIEASSRGSVSRLLLNWHTGARASAVVPPGRALDLDDATGSHALCEGVAGLVGMPGFIYRSRRAVYQRGAASRVALYVKPCDGRSRRLASHRSGSFKTHLGEDVVTWVDGATVAARELMRGRTKRWSVPRTVGVTAGVAGRHLVVSAPLGTGRFAIYRGRLPST